MLRGFTPATQIRERLPGGGVKVSSPEPQGAGLRQPEPRASRTREGKRQSLRIYPYAISRERLERAINELGVAASITNDLSEADVLLTLKSHAKRQSEKLRQARSNSVEVHIIRNNTLTQIENFLRAAFGIRSFAQTEESGMQEVEDGVAEALERNRPVELSPQPKHVRRMQHLYAERSGLSSESKGLEPMRRVVIYPHR
jgi:predicted RNA-binding protein Jag